MANTKDSGKRRRGSHFAASGTKSNINWGGWDDEGQEGGWDNKGQATDINSDISYTTSLDLEDLLDAGTPRSTVASATDSFDRIPTGTGALFTTRDTVSNTSSIAHFAFDDEGISSVRMADSRRPRVTSAHKPAKPVHTVVSIIVAVLALSASAFVAYTLITQFILGDTQETVVEESAQVLAVGESVEVGGYEYQLSQAESGIYLLVRLTTGESLTLAELSGTPVALVYSSGTFYIPENTEAGWDIACYTLGDGSIATTYKDEEGNAITGASALVSVEVSDDNLVLTDETGEETILALE